MPLPGLRKSSASACLTLARKIFSCRNCSARWSFGAIALLRSCSDILWTLVGRVSRNEAVGRNKSPDGLVVVDPDVGTLSGAITLALAAGFATKLVD